MSYLTHIKKLYETYNDDRNILLSLLNTSNTSDTSNTYSDKYWFLKNLFTTGNIRNNSYIFYISELTETDLALYLQKAKDALLFLAIQLKNDSCHFARHDEQIVVPKRDMFVKYHRFTYASWALLSGYGSLLFDFDGMVLSDDIFLKIVDAIEKSPKRLQYLNVTNCGLSIEKIQRLCRINKLKFVVNFMTDDNDHDKIHNQFGLLGEKCITYSKMSLLKHINDDRIPISENLLFNHFQFYEFHRASLTHELFWSRRERLINEYDLSFSIKKNFKSIVPNATKICISLQDRNLPTPLMIDIIISACGPIAQDIPYHYLWKLVVIVKHFNDRKKECSS
jgi:hypothetical protein